MIYFGAGIAGNLAAQLVNPGGLVVGASGAIVGLIGLLLAYGIRRGGVGGQAIKGAMMRWYTQTLAWEQHCCLRMTRF